jgi:hypothetical protein
MRGPALAASGLSATSSSNSVGGNGSSASSAAAPPTAGNNGGPPTPVGPAEVTAAPARRDTPAASPTDLDTPPTPTSTKTAKDEGRSVPPAEGRREPQGPMSLAEIQTLPPGVVDVAPTPTKPPPMTLGEIQALGPEVGVKTPTGSAGNAGVAVPGWTSPKAPGGAKGPAVVGEGTAQGGDGGEQLAKPKYPQPSGAVETVTRGEEAKGLPPTGKAETKGLAGTAGVEGPKGATGSPVGGGEIQGADGGTAAARPKGPPVPSIGSGGGIQGLGKGQPAEKTPRVTPRTGSKVQELAAEFERAATPREGGRARETPRGREGPVIHEAPEKPAVQEAAEKPAVQETPEKPAVQEAPGKLAAVSQEGTAKTEGGKTATPVVGAASGAKGADTQNEVGAYHVFLVLWL